MVTKVSRTTAADMTPNNRPHQRRALAWPASILGTLLVVFAASPLLATVGPYDLQVDANVQKLADGSPEVRARAVEALGFLRAYRAEESLIACLADDVAEVRRQAAMALGWCGGRKAVPRLLAALGDDDWLTRQAAHVALTNLTGMEFPFDAVANTRREQAQRWRQWWAAVRPNETPGEVLDLLGGSSGGVRMLASTTYRGPADVLLDGRVGPAYWQTKNVPTPQWCTLDLGRPRDVSRVVVHQYGPGFVMTEYEVSTSLDNRTFDPVRREKGVTPVELVVEFPSRKARYLRITSFGSVKATYPTTFFEIDTDALRPDEKLLSTDRFWRQERGLRALGVLGDNGASERIINVLGPVPSKVELCRAAGRAGIRSLGRLREEVGLEYLIGLLEDPFWARHAAAALGEFGDRRAVGALIRAYTRYGKDLQGLDPKDVPADDKMGFPSEDRMLETPYWIAYALCRLPLDDLDALRRIAPQIMANLPGDHDTFMLYEPEVGHRLTRYLLEQAGLRQEASEQAFMQLGQPRRVPAPDDSMAWSQLPPRQIASWLPCVCIEKEDLPRLLRLLGHKDGWVRLNAAKAIGWLGDRRAIEPVARLLAEAKAEADFGYSVTFKDEEYNDPAPRWREGLVRALGLLGADEHTDLLVKVLDDERSVLEVRRAAAEALVDLGNERALQALRKAAVEHSFHSIRHVARDALQQRGIRSETHQTTRRVRETHQAPATSKQESLQAIVFIQGSNNIPNTIGTVEQADRWRQTYVVTDSGPTYRPGRNLVLLHPPRPDGQVRPLTTFADGYVADVEVSWDATHVLFSHRGQADPWWHVWRINVDGSGLKQLTFGPYHDVGPTYLPDGRIVFASSRSGIRDEYHGYPCTALYVMEAEGGDMHPIATNIGRDNEPTVLHDGRIAMSRLEVFYSRNKTELTLHAMHPDGTKDMVLYGPERRVFWRGLNHGPRTPADGQEAPLTHRVLRMTQPQPLPFGQGIVVVTQGGLAKIGPRRDTEEILTPDNQTRAYTTPFPLPDGRILCASTLKVSQREEVDLGLYLFDPSSKQLELLYNDPGKADFEPRPILARRPPMMQPVATERHAYSGRFFCSSVFTTREAEVRRRGRLVRLIEGVPVVGRHSTQTNENPVWQNHGGTFARVLGTLPLASDGSFFVEAPADRLVHFQVLDSDRRVVGNQLTWIYLRPGETKSCVGCHETPHATTGGHNPLASHYPPAKFLPTGHEFTYRAKAWFKGRLPSEIEERTRTVRAVNLLAR